MNTSEELWTETEVAGLLKVALPTLRNWRCKGIGPAFLKVGQRCVRYRVADVHAFIEAGEHAAQPAGRLGGQTAGGAA